MSTRGLSHNHIEFTAKPAFEVRHHAEHRTTPGDKAVPHVFHPAQKVDSNSLDSFINSCVAAPSWTLWLLQLT